MIRIEHHFGGNDLSPADYSAIRDAMAAALISSGRRSIAVDHIGFPAGGGRVVLFLTLGDEPGAGAEDALASIDWDAVPKG